MSHDHPAAELAIDVRNVLGEGPVWHPGRQQLLWCDVNRQCVYASGPRGEALTVYGFGEPVSAVFLEDVSRVAVAGASGLWRLDLDTDARALLFDIDAGNPATRSNDARAAPGGALWMSTMGRDHEDGAGAIFHVRGDQVTRLWDKISVANAICFSPAGDRGYFADSFLHKIMTCRVDPATGLPTSEPELFVDLGAEGLIPDGAVVDASGALWNAQWGAGKVTCYAPSGAVVDEITTPASQPTCPCFGGAGMDDMFITSARRDLTRDDLLEQPSAGGVFTRVGGFKASPERMVHLKE